MIKSIFLSKAIKLSIVIKDHCHLKSRLMGYRLRSFLSLEAGINNSVASTPPPSISKDSDLSNGSSWQSLCEPHLSCSLFLKYNVFLYRGKVCLWWLQVRKWPYFWKYWNIHGTEKLKQILLSPRAQFLQGYWGGLYPTDATPPLGYF